MTGSETASDVGAPWGVASRVALGFVMVLGAMRAVRTFLPAVLSPDRFDGDACQHVWWMYRFADPALFPGDFAADYFSRPSHSPLGYQAIFRLLAPHVDVQVLSELLPLLLALPTVLLAFMLGRKAAGGSDARVATGGVIAAVLLVLLPGNLRLLEAGLARSFALPLLLLGVWALWNRRMVWLGAAFVLAVLFYPPVIVNLGLLMLAGLGWQVCEERRLPLGWPWLVALGAVALLILALAHSDGDHAGFGPRVSGAAARQLPEFGPGGRSEAFVANWSEAWFTQQRLGLGYHPLQFAIVALGVSATAWWLRGVVPRMAWLVLLTSLAAFLLAHAVLFSLYLPNRYTRLGLPVFCLLWLAAAVPELLVRLGATRALTRARAALLFGVAPVILLALAGESWQRVRHVASLAPRAGLAETYAFLEGLPVDTLVAAHPRDASAIPLRSRRSVLAAMETALPYDRGYYAIMEPRIEAELVACYAASWVDVEALAEDFGVDVFVVNRAAWSDPRYRAYFVPFRARNLERIVRGEREGFVLLDPPTDRVLFRSGDFTVVRLGN